MNKLRHRIVVLIFIFCCGLSIVGVSQNEIDPVINYYLSNTDSVLSSDYIFNSEVSFSFNLTSIFKITNYRGEIEKIDTAIYKLFYNGGNRDSVSIIDSAQIEENALPDSFIVFLPNSEENIHYFFPNDTGIGRLAIGFETTDSTAENNYAGLMNIDRDNFQIQQLLIHDLNPDRFNSLSVIYEFKVIDSLIVFDKIEKQGVKSRFLGKKYSQQFLDFSDYIIKK